MNDENLIQLIIVLALTGLIVFAILIDGQMGEKLLDFLLVSYGAMMGYFFRKLQDKKETKEEIKI